jgi:tRNA A-37 threonylcarbamoyl transferase component Bud32
VTEGALSLDEFFESKSPPVLPCVLRVESADGASGAPRTLILEGLLRWLPQRRFVFRATLDGMPVLVKCFPGLRGRRSLARERSGRLRLEASNLPAPREYLAAVVPSGSVLVMEWISEARPLDLSIPEQQRAAVCLLAELHKSSLSHSDPHAGNFLLRSGLSTPVLVDTGAIRARPLWCRGRYRVRSEWRELARLVVQCPMDSLIADNEGWTDRPEIVRRLVETYCRRRGDEFREISPGAWSSLLRAARRDRVRRYLRKTLRSTTEFEQRDRPDARVFVLRAALSPALEAVIADPAAAMASGESLKAGRSATVVRPRGAPGLVIKRYNQRNLLQSLRRRLAPRARAAWRNGHHLALLGIPTARPLALIESNKGAGTPYLVLEDHGDCAIDRHARTAGVSERLAMRVSRLLLGLRRADIAHRDTKATNLLVTAEERVVLIDLDGMRSRLGGDPADAARFLANWTQPDDQALHSRFEAALRRVGLVT